MYNSFSEKKLTYLPEIVLFVLFGFIQISHINIDFWNDEIYTIKHFILTSPVTTISDYHAPNNHIFFNLINNIYLKIIGIDSLNTLFDNPWKLRLIPFIFSFITAYFTYKIGRKFVNRTVGLLALIILITSVPYYNFSLQIRGYGLSIMLGVLLIYYLLSYLNDPKRKEIVVIGFLSCFLLYSIPSNLYFLLSIIFALGLFILIGKRIMKVLFINKYSFSIYAILIGTLLAVLLYLPILNNVFSNENVKFGDHFSLLDFKSKVIHTGYGLVYNRWLLISLSIVGLLIGRKSLMKNSKILLLSISVIVVPLIIVWVSGQEAPPRIFTLCLPFVALFMAVSIFIGWNKYFHLDRKKDWLIVSCVFLIATFSLFYQLDKVEKQMITDIHEGRRTQSLFYQYYSARYSPLENIKTFKTIYTNNELPVVAIGYEPHGISNYLEKFEIPYYFQIDFDSLLINNESVYVITNHPFKFVKRNDLNTEILNSELSYHNLLIVSKK